MKRTACCSTRRGCWRYAHIWSHVSRFERASHQADVRPSFTSYDARLHCSHACDVPVARASS